MNDCQKKLLQEASDIAHSTWLFDTWADKLASRDKVVKIRQLFTLLSKVK